MWTPPANLTIYQMRPLDTGPLLKSVWVALYGAHPRAMFAISHFSVFRSSPVARGRLNPPAGMPGPTHKQKIVRAFFQKRAIELQTAVMTPMTRFTEYRPVLGELRLWTGYGFHFD